MFFKKRSLLIILLIFLSIILSGCSAEQTFNSAVDNTYTQKFNNLLVMFRTDSIRLTQEVEGNRFNPLNMENMFVKLTHS
jgi:PBP1b-binding outer membrane lipoprotein LpoB